MMHDFLLIVTAVSISSLVTIVCVGTLKIEMTKYIESVEATLEKTWEMILKVAGKNN